MTKPFHAGLAARIGVLSAWMAGEGFTANTAIFDDGGFFKTYGGKDGESLADVVALMGKPWEMAKPAIYVKRWPCCYCNHRPIACGRLHGRRGGHETQPLRDAQRAGGCDGVSEASA